MNPRVPSRENQLLINFSGCANPFADERIFEKYVAVLAEAIIAEASKRFAKIVFCCNERLARFLRERIFVNQVNSATTQIRAAHFAHRQFIEMLAKSELLLTAPGITTTLEAVATSTPIAFLLPQNYSQALMSEQYRKRLGDPTVMTLSRFGKDFNIPTKLPEREGVELALRCLDEILDNHRERLQTICGEMLQHDVGRSAIEELRDIPACNQNVAGQEFILKHLRRSRMFD